MTRPGDAEGFDSAASGEELLVDALTGLSSRHKLMADLDDAIEPSSETTLLVIFDIDGLQRHAENAGEEEANRLLVRLAAQLTRVLDQSATCYRTRAWELSALITAPIPAAMTLLTEAVSAFERLGEEADLSASFGAAILPDEATEPIEALMIADERLFISAGRRAKSTRVSHSSVS